MPNHALECPCVECEKQEKGLFAVIAVLNGKASAGSHMAQDVFCNLYEQYLQKNNGEKRAR